jgi:hypothetical protein
MWHFATTLSALNCHFHERGKKLINEFALKLKAQRVDIAQHFLK